jgi:dihydroflavonol-4-reductase
MGTIAITGATGFVGAHVARELTERGHDVRVIYRNPDRLAALGGLEVDRAQADVLDYKAMREALRGCDTLFHVAGFVGSKPFERVWRLNAHAPVVAVEAAAAEGLQRAVVTSTISAIGVARDGVPADEDTDYPENWLGLVYPDSKHQGERGALDAGERHGIDVVVVNPAYVLGVPVNRDQPGETSTRTIGNYLLGRLPAVVGAPMNFADVRDVAIGHILAAERGHPGERYILGAENSTWPRLIERVAALSGVHHPVIVLHPAISRVARVREAAGLRGPMPAEATDLMGREWRFTSAKARRVLGYEPRELDETLQDTIDWYQELIENGAFAEQSGSSLSRIAGGVQAASTLGMLTPLRIGQRVLGRRMLVGL